MTTRLGWVACLAGLALPMMAAAAPGGSIDAPSMPERQLSPQEIARNAYNDGVRAVKRADKYDKDAAEAVKESKKVKAAERAHKQYQKARNYFAAAVAKQTTMHEAWNYIGYTSRKLGEYEQALKAYDQALRIKPDYELAIEYRGVAYIVLNRTEEAKAAYMRLFGSNRNLADQLMQAMRQWVSERRAHPSGVAAADIDAFAQWLDERIDIAQQTASLAVDAPTEDWR